MKTKKTFLISIFLCLSLSFLLAAPKIGSEKALFTWFGDENYKSPNNVIIDKDSLSHQSEGLKDGWFKNSGFYQIWVKSFKDSDGDGCGDFKGITEELDYIKNTLGFDGIWLSPIFECNGKSKKIGNNMHGYDVIDYYAVNSYFGTEDDLLELLDEAHKRGIKVIFDFVPNHTSNLNQWFIDSAKKKNNKESWYLWSKKQLPWNPMGSSSTWHKNLTRNLYFYGCFWSGMPDLNYRNYEVREEMKNVVRYWCNKGFDGIRVDAVMYLMEDEKEFKNIAETHKWFNELRKDVFDKYAEIGYPKFMVAESWISGDRENLNAYFGTEDASEFHTLFDFEAGNPITNSVKLGKDTFTSSIKKTPDNNSKTAYGAFLGNHDEYNDRLGSFFLNDTKRQKLASAILMLRPTVPFIYYGNEIGQTNASVNGDIRLRYPYDWDLAKTEMADSKSLLNLNRAMLKLRSQYSAIRDGDLAVLTATKSEGSSVADTVAYTLSNKEQTVLCVFNMSTKAKETAVFTGTNTPKVGSKAALAIGDASAPNVKIENEKVTVYKMAPLSYRVYILNKNASVLFDDETYIAGERYSPPAPKVNKMFIRGNFNNWSGYSDLMKKTQEGSETVWVFDVKLTPQNILFKFDSSGNWAKGLYWGKGSEEGTVSNNTDYNLSQEIKEEGTYRFKINVEKGTYSVTKI